MPMEILLPSLIVFFDLAVPTALLVWLWKCKAKSRLYFLSIVLLNAVYLVAIKLSFFGFWHVLGSFWPYAFGFAGATFFLVRIRQGLPTSWWPLGAKEAVLVGVNVLHATGWLLVTIGAMKGRSVEAASLELSAPLRTGTFLVIGGGSNVTVNQHTRATQYALDISKLNSFGTRARSLALFPRDVTEYEIYGVDVVAPCAGEVLGVENALVDQAPLHPASNSIGNYVALFCKGHTVRLLHLKPGSVKVTVGQSVASGQLLGSVGNSGNTVEPHLHIDAIEGRHLLDTRNDRDIASAPIRIDGRFLVKGDSFAGL